MDQKTQADKAQERGTQQLHNQPIPDQPLTHQAADAAGALQRARRGPPSALSPADILALQKTVGNRAVQRLLAGGPGPTTQPPGIVQRQVDPSTEKILASARKAAMKVGVSLDSLGDARGKALKAQESTTWPFIDAVTANYDVINAVGVLPSSTASPKSEE